MKSRREVLSSLLIDLAKAIFIALVLGRIINPEVVGYYALIFGIITTVFMVSGALLIQPKHEVDKELAIWR